MKKLVSILLVNHNNNLFTIDCLRSLTQQTYPNIEIIIVDNGSKYETYLDLKKQIQEFNSKLKIELIRSDRKLYFSGGTNKELKEAKGDYICLLNNDTEVVPDFIEKSIEYLEKNDNIGMMCSKILFFEDKRRIWYAGAYLNPRSRDFTYHIGLNQIDKGQFDEITETGFANGAALFTTRKVVDEIGLWDEIYFMYVDDLDWNYRAKKKGYKLLYFPKTVAYHKVSLITKENKLGYRGNPFQIYLYTRNKIIFVLKHYSYLDIIHYFIKHQFKSSISELYLSIVQRKPAFFIAQIRALIKGILIGIKRRTHRSCRKLLISEYNYLNKFTKYKS
jgi:GT2 family glycosyltransferase